MQLLAPALGGLIQCVNNYFSPVNIVLNILNAMFFAWSCILVKIILG